MPIPKRNQITKKNLASGGASGRCGRSTIAPKSTTTTPPNSATPDAVRLGLIFPFSNILNVDEHRNYDAFQRRVQIEACARVQSFSLILPRPNSRIASGAPGGSL